MKKVLSIVCATIAVFMLNSIDSYGFKNGPVMNIVADVGGSSTMPSISDSDLAKLGANKMEGMTGLIAGGILEVGYIFGAEEYFGFDNDDIFSGVGVFGYVGVGSGYAGQISGSEVTSGGEISQVDVYFNVHYTPVISLGVSAKAYFLKNRVAVGLQLGTKIIADTQPVYEMYNNQGMSDFTAVGTIIVEDWMMTKMNAFSFNFKAGVEYYVPILDTLEFILGAYIGGNIYTPKYITMPSALLDAAVSEYDFDPTEPVESYYINSIEYGIRAGIALKL